MWFTETSMTLASICSTSILRSTNAAVAVICCVIIYDLLIQLRPNLGEKRATIYAIVLALYPLHWFFTFLYYTDVASLTAVLAMYLASIKRHYWLSATVRNLALLTIYHFPMQFQFHNNHYFSKISAAAHLFFF